jgi:hypothetical protein
VEDAVGVLVLAHDLAAVVDVERLAGDRTRDIQPDIAAAVQQEPADLGAVIRHGAGGVAVLAHDLAVVVDPLGLGALGPGRVDLGEPAPLVEQEAAGGAADGLLVGADDLAAVVEVDRGDGCKVLQSGWGRD